MTIPYEKWDATGNDFVLVDLDRSSLSEEEFTPELARALCRRDTGVGADGVVLLKAAPGEEPSQVTIWNSDGSLGVMCGNALRCVALVLARRPGPLERRVVIGGRTVHTRAGEDGTSIVAMGPASQVGAHAPFSSLAELDEVLEGRGYLLSFGNPHYVLPVSVIPQNWAELGARAQSVAHGLLGTGGINCGFLQTSAPQGQPIPLRVFERGVGVTRSCGSGACAASAVLAHQLGVAPPHRLELLGGVLEIGRQGADGYTLSGPAHMEFEGVWTHP